MTTLIEEAYRCGLKRNFPLKMNNILRCSRGCWIWDPTSKRVSSVEGFVVNTFTFVRKLVSTTLKRKIVATHNGNGMIRSGDFGYFDKPSRSTVFYLCGNIVVIAQGNLMFYAGNLAMQLEALVRQFHNSDMKPAKHVSNARRQVSRHHPPYTIL